LEKILILDGTYFFSVTGYSVSEHWALGIPWMSTSIATNTNQYGHQLHASSSNSSKILTSIYEIPLINQIVTLFRMADSYDHFKQSLDANISILQGKFYFFGHRVENYFIITPHFPSGL
jgi:hypothetical protein